MNKDISNNRIDRIGFAFAFVGGVTVIARYLMGGGFQLYGFVILLFGVGMLLASLVKR